MAQPQSEGVALRMTREDRVRMLATPQDMMIPMPARVVVANGLLHEGRKGVARLTVQNIGAVPVYINTQNEDGNGAAWSKVLAADSVGGATPAGDGTEGDLTPYAAKNIMCEGIGGAPAVTVNLHLWRHHELM